MKKPLAVFTIVHNEKYMLPIWLRYYKKHVPPEDLYVIDHDSTDGSTSGTGFVRVPWSNSLLFEHGALRARVEAFQRELQLRYHWVLFAEADEIVAPNPEKYSSIGELISDVPKSWGYVRCLGWEIAHQRFMEPPYTYDLPLMQQRGWWLRKSQFDKPILSRVGLQWVDGFHRLRGRTTLPFKDLYLLHLHFWDCDLARQRHFNRLDREVSEVAKRARKCQNAFRAVPEWERHFQAHFSDAVPIPPPWNTVNI